MSIGSSYKQTKIEDQWDAIVIGSGIGGLTTAALLARLANKRVLVLEKHYTAGGFTHTFTRPGYEWDVGVHYIGEVQRPSSLMRRVFDYISSKELRWADMGEIYDTIVVGDKRFQFPRGKDAFAARMKEYFPDQKAAIDNYMKRIAQAARHSRGFFMEKVLPMAIARFVGPLLRFTALRDANKTVNEVLFECGISSGSLLATVLTGQYGDYGLPPGQASFLMHAILVKHYLAGAAYPIGGSSQIARTITNVIEHHGGRVITRAQVTSVVFENDRARGVTLADGRVLSAPIIVSDVGWVNTWKNLVPAELQRAKNFEASLKDVPPSSGHAALYVGINKDAASLNLSPSNIWVYPGHDHDRSVDSYLGDPTKPLPLAYLSFPSAKDPSFSNRFPGRSTIEVIGLAPWSWFKSYENTAWHKRGPHYEAIKENLSKRLLDALYQQCPQVKGHVEHAELSTPVTTKHFVSHEEGEIYGLAHNPARFCQPQLRPQTPFSGFYLTGSDICTAGVGGALMGGVMSATVILRRNVLSAVLKQTS